MIEVLKMLEKGIYLSNHVKDKMQIEKISLTEVKKVLLNAQIDFSRNVRVNRVNALNVRNHLLASYEGLTVCFCESQEKGIFLISVFKGKPYEIKTNPSFFNKIDKF